MGITKQRLYYWEIRKRASLPRKTVCAVIERAKALFALSEKACESLAAAAGVSPTIGDKPLYEVIRTVYKGSIRRLCAAASIDERALRNYKNRLPPKQILLPLCAALGLNDVQTDAFLRQFGYCLSASILTDCVAAFYLRKNSAQCGVKTLNAINETLFSMRISTLGVKSEKK